MDSFDRGRIGVHYTRGPIGDEVGADFFRSSPSIFAEKLHWCSSMNTLSPIAFLSCLRFFSNDKGEGVYLLYDHYIALKTSPLIVTPIPVRNSVILAHYGYQSY